MNDQAGDQANQQASDQASDQVGDQALEEALERIGDLAQRLWAVRGTHRPVRSRTLTGRVVVQCSGCGRPSPCPTLRAAGPR